MTLKSLFLSSAILCGAAAAHAQDEAVQVNLADAPAAPAAPELTDLEKLNTFGWLIGFRAGLAELELSEAEVGALLAGMTSAARGEELPFELEVVGPSMSSFIQEKQQLYINKMREREMVKSAAFMKAVKEKEGVMSLDSGLAYEILTEGTGAHPAASDRVRVNYTGALIDGTIFDSTNDRGPYETVLDAVIPGWTEGVPMNKVGGTIRLYVPPHLGYGDRGSGQIPPGATLVFDVELLEILPAETAVE